VLGIFWSFLQPLLTMIVLTIVFSTLFGGRIENYPVYLLTGRLVFDFYAQGSKTAMNSIKSNAAIIKKVYVPKYMYTLGSVLSNFVTFGLSLVVLIMVMVATQADFTIYISLAIIPIILLFMFTLGAGLLLSTISVFFRDMEHLYGIFITLLMYGSAIFYPIDIIPENFRFLFEINPIYVIITLFRDSFYYGKIYDPKSLLFATFSAVVILILGIYLFYKYQDKFILYI
jgi:lipopolysaccharide transport system permease protein